MKLKFIFILLLVGLFAQAQIPGYTTINSRYEWLGGKFKALTLPAYGDTAFQTGQYRGAGAVVIDTTGSNKGLYVWYDMYWHRVALGADATNIYSTDGTLVGDRTLTGDNYAYVLRLDSLHKFYVDAREEGVGTRISLVEAAVSKIEYYFIDGDDEVNSRLQFDGGATPNVLMTTTSGKQLGLTQDSALLVHNNSSATLSGGHLLARSPIGGLFDYTGSISADNFATTNLTLTGSRTHNFDGNGMSWNNVNEFNLYNGSGTQRRIGIDASASQLSSPDGNTSVNVSDGAIILTGSGMPVTISNSDSLRIPGLGRQDDSTAVVTYNKVTGSFGYANKSTSGSTPTFQQVLTAGSTLTGNNTIAGGSHDFVWNSMSGFNIYSDAGTTNRFKLNSTGTTIYNPSGTSILDISDSVRLKTIGISRDTVAYKVMTQNPITGAIAYSNYLYAGSGGLTTVAFGSTPNSNGGGISGATLTLQPANGTNPGGVSTTTQSFAGAKTFTNQFFNLASTIFDDNGSRLRVSPPTGYMQILTSGTGGLLDIFNSTGTDGVFISGPSKSIQTTVGSNLVLQTGTGSTLTVGGLILNAGTTTRSPFGFTPSGAALLTSPVSGRVEVLNDKLYYTIPTGTARKEITLNDATLTSGTVPVATTDGRLTDGLIIAASSYTPTLTNGGNVTSSTAAVCQYTRVGDRVTVTGILSISATLVTTNTAIDISLPIASNFANTTDLSGVAAYNGTAAGMVTGSVANDRASVFFVPAGIGSTSMTFTFTYQII